MPEMRRKRSAEETFESTKAIILKLFHRPDVTENYVTINMIKDKLGCTRRHAQGVISGYKKAGLIVEKDGLSGKEKGYVLDKKGIFNLLRRLNLNKVTFTERDKKLDYKEWVSSTKGLWTEEELANFKKECGPFIGEAKKSFKF